MCHKICDTDRVIKWELPVDRRVAATRRAVLDAALTVALSEGIAAVTPTRIATEAGVGRRTIYRHWRTTEQLIADAFADASYPSYAPTGVTLDDVRSHLGELARALNVGPLARVLHLLGERSTMDDGIAAVRARLVHEGCAPLAAVLRSAGVPRDQTDLLVPLIEGALMHRALVVGEPITDELIDEAVEVAHQLLLRYGVEAKISSA